MDIGEDAPAETADSVFIPAVTVVLPAPLLPQALEALTFVVPTGASESFGIDIYLFVLALIQPRV